MSEGNIHHFKEADLFFIYLSVYNAIILHVNVVHKMHMHKVIKVPRYNKHDAITCFYGAV